MKYTIFLYLEPNKGYIERERIQLFEGEREKINGFLKFWKLYRPETDISIYKETDSTWKSGQSKSFESTNYLIIFLGQTKEWKEIK